MRAFAQKLNEVGAPAPSEEMRVDRDSFATNGEKIHIRQLSKGKRHLT